MARGKRRAPFKPTVDKEAQVEDANDEVDDFVAQRHKVMLEKAVQEDSDSDDLGPEPENHERAVLNIDMSDSSSSEGSDDSDDDVDVHENQKGWGKKSKDWYGADTHEYEIMEDDEREEAFKDEEEEAVRIQKEELAGLRPEDFWDGGEGSEAEGEAPEGHRDINGIEMLEDRPTGEALESVAPELPVLLREMLESRQQAVIWKDRVHWNELARTIYHLHASFVNNVAFYLSLRTDPDSHGVNLRTHPVLVQIVRVRNVLEEALSLPCEEPTLEKSITPTDINGSGSFPTGAQPSTANGHLKTVGNQENVVEKIRRKRKKRKNRSISNGEVDDGMQSDEERVKSVLVVRPDRKEPDSNNQEKDRKRKKLNRLIGALERDRKNNDVKRQVSGDMDVIREEADKAKSTLYVSGDQQGAEMDLDNMEDNEAVMEKMLAKSAKKEARKAKKAAESEPHVYTFKDDVNVDARRRASSQVVKNRGLTRYRPKDKKTPRTKNRIAYGKAVIRRKGAVREYTGTPGSTYSGEASGINKSVRKGSRLSNI